MRVDLPIVTVENKSIEPFLEGGGVSLDGEMDIDVSLDVGVHGKAGRPEPYFFLHFPLREKCGVCKGDEKEVLRELTYKQSNNGSMRTTHLHNNSRRYYCLVPNIGGSNM